ncbi:MAG: ribonuclease III family protein [Promethearchaeota archaeon]
MDYEFLIRDLELNKSQKVLGTDKGLAKLGDAIVNLTYSMAKSIYLTKNNPNNKVLRTGVKVSKKILATALKNANMRKFAKTRADAHDFADTAEALVAYVWLSKKISLDEIINYLLKNLKGDLNIRNEEIKSATEAFTEFFNYIKKFLPKK